MSLIDCALQYADIGWSVIPLKQDKRPYISWKSYQGKPATKAQIKKWWAQYPDANIGIVTGKVSGLIVIDLDSDEGQEAYIAECGELHSTIAQKTGKGLHLLFRHPGDTEYSNMARTLTDVDIRGDGGYIMAAPSLHPNGSQYEWTIDPVENELMDLMDLPPEVKSILKSSNGTKPKNEEGWVQDVLLGVGKGQRNDMAAKLAGHYFRLGRPEAEVESLLTLWNERNQPPLPFGELRKAIHSISQREGRQKVSEAISSENGHVEVEDLEVLVYPDGSRAFNVKLKDHEQPIRLKTDDWLSFAKFSRRVYEVTLFQPKPIKQEHWREYVNQISKEARMTEVPYDETLMGAVINVINSALKNNSAADNFQYLDTRIVVTSGPHGTGRERGPFIAFKVSTIANMLLGFGERVKRPQVGAILDFLGVKKNDKPRDHKGNQKRCCTVPLSLWNEKYGE